MTSTEEKILTSASNADREKYTTSSQELGLCKELGSISINYSHQNNNVDNSGEADHVVPLDILIVDSNLSNELLCPVCLQTLCEPRQCVNGHSTCLICLTDLTNQGNTNLQCPVCRCKMESQGRNLFLEWQLDHLVVWCKYHFRKTKFEGFIHDLDGCQEKFEVAQIKEHEKSCPFSFVDCPYSRRCKMMRRFSLSDHLLCCIFRPIHCAFCKTTIQFSELKTHHSVCEELLVQCEFCTTDIRRIELDHHYKNDCPMCPIECPYKVIGCINQTMVADKLEQHKVEYVAKHLELVQADFNKKLSTLKNSFQMKLAQKEKQIIDMKHSWYQQKKYFLWKVDWKKIHNVHYQASNPFLINGCQFYLGIFPRGDPGVIESKSHMSLYLFIDTKTSILGTKGKPKKIILEWIFRVVNKDPLLSLAKRFETKFPVVGGEGWGDSNMISVDKLIEESGFIQESRYLILECEICFTQEIFHL